MLKFPFASEVPPVIIFLVSDFEIVITANSIGFVVSLSIILPVIITFFNEI